jgi:hypothetical protein
LAQNFRKLVIYVDLRLPKELEQNKTSQTGFLPECGQGWFANFLKILSQKNERDKMLWSKMCLF